MTAVYYRCVVCGAEDIMRISEYFDITHDDNHNVYTVTSVRARNTNELFAWADSMPVGVCVGHDQDELITALRMRGPFPHGFKIMEGNLNG